MLVGANYTSRCIMLALAGHKVNVKYVFEDKMTKY